MNLATLGEENVGKFGEYVALHFEGREYTNVEQQRAGARVANALRGLGVGVGDRVVVLLPNCPEVTQAYGGILRLGAVNHVRPVIFSKPGARLIASHPWDFRFAPGHGYSSSG